MDSVHELKAVFMFPVSPTHSLICYKRLVKVGPIGIGMARTTPSVSFVVYMSEVRFPTQRETNRR